MLPPSMRFSSLALKTNLSLPYGSPGNTAHLLRYVAQLVPDDSCIYSFVLSHFKKGEWKRESAGGCLNEKTFSKNSFFLLTIPKTVPHTSHLPVCVMLEQQRDPSDVIAGQIVPYEIYIGYYVFDVGKPRTSLFMYSSFSFFLAFFLTMLTSQNLVETWESTSDGRTVTKCIPHSPST